MDVTGPSVGNVAEAGGDYEEDTLLVCGADSPVYIGPERRLHDG